MGRCSGSSTRGCSSQSQLYSGSSALLWGFLFFLFKSEIQIKQLGRGGCPFLDFPCRMCWKVFAAACGTFIIKKNRLSLKQTTCLFVLASCPAPWATDSWSSRQESLLLPGSVRDETPRTVSEGGSKVQNNEEGEDEKGHHVSPARCLSSAGLPGPRAPKPSLAFCREPAVT